MSPEQASAGPVDRRSDIWSLAIVIHEMLAGARPFHGDDQNAVLQAILTSDPQLTATSYPDVPAGIERLLHRALAKAPDQRYASMALLAADLSALASEPASRPQRQRDRRGGAHVDDRAASRRGAGHRGVGLSVARRSDDAGRGAAPDRAAP